MLTTLEQLEKIRDIAINKMNEIIGREKRVSEPETKVEAEPSASYEEVGEEGDAEEDVSEVSEFKESVPPEPEATQPRPVGRPAGRRGRNGEVNKSDLIREYFRSHPKARNQEVIAHVKEKHKIELQPSLVSTVKRTLNIPKGKPGRRKAAAATAVAKAKKSKKGTLPMVACVTKVMSKAKKGMHIDQVVGGVEKLYSYGGKKGSDGLKNVVYQALYSLSLKKNRRGWEGAAPIVLHDDVSHTWKLNPKAKRKIA